MDFFSIIIHGYIFTACLIGYFVVRDLQREKLFFNKYKEVAYIFLAVLGLGIIAAVDTYYIEPNIIITKKIEIPAQKDIPPIKIALITDIQVGLNKKTAWAEKIAEKIEKMNPDLVLFGGDQISNEQTFIDETIYLEPLAKVARLYPTYAVLGNHEYGLGACVRDNKRYGTGDRSQMAIDGLSKLGIQTLKNNLVCSKIKNQEICIFGIDDIWGGEINFEELQNWDQAKYLIYLTHNPDGILYWPEKYPKPDITLAGHTHNGQIYLPIWGPVGDAGVELGFGYYHGLNYWHDIPIITSAGAGESGGQIRFYNPPEIVEIEVR